MAFKFELRDKVTIDASVEHCEVVGRAEYTTHENMYLIRYVSPDNLAMERWWGESILHPVKRAA